MVHDANHTTRRRFLKQAGAAGVTLGAVGCGSNAGTGAQATASAPQATQTAAAPAAGGGALPKKRLGKTNVEVPTLGAGMGVTVTPILLNRALDSGITYLDTAEGYGKGASETAIGKILKANGRRAECWIVTKTGDHNWENLESHLDGSLARLQTDYFDIIYLHNLGDASLLDDNMAKAAERLIATGKVRHFGLSSHHPKMISVMDKAADVGYIEVIMFKYNFHAYDDAELNRVMDKCHAADIGLVAMKTQGGAKDSFQDRVNPFKQRGLNQYQAALRAVYEDERITSIVSAMKNVRQVEENAGAARQPQLSAMERDAIVEYRLASRSSYCQGSCATECMTQFAADTNVPDIMRHLMYYEDYGDRRAARTLFGRLPAAERHIRGVDFRAAEEACPFGLRIGEMLERAETLLA